MSQRRAVSYATPSSVATAGTLPRRRYSCRSARSSGFRVRRTIKNANLKCNDTDPAADHTGSVPSNKRARQRLNKLAGQPVSIVVCAYPARTIEPAIGLLKSSVLYADEVLLHSPVASMVAAVEALASGGGEGLIDLVLGAENQGFHPQLTEVLKSAVRGGEWGDNAEVLRQLANPHSALRRQFGRQLEEAGVPLDEFDSRMAAARADISTVVADHAVLAGLDQIEPAIDAGIVKIEPVDMSGDDLAGYFGQLEALLGGATKHYPLFDDQRGDLMAQMMDLARTQRDRHAVRRGAEAAIANRLLAQLPTFPLASMDEVVGIRDDLRSPLIRFRSEMVRVTAELKLDALDRDFDDSAMTLWYERVAPALDELNEVIAESGLIRTYGREAALALGVPAANGMAIGLGTGNWTVASLWSMANLAVTSGRAANDARQRARHQTRSNPYFFLHTVDRRLA